MTNEHLIDAGRPLTAGNVASRPIGPAVFQIPQSFLDSIEELSQMREQLEEASRKMEAASIELAIPGMRRRWARRI